MASIVVEKPPDRLESNDHDVQTDSKTVKESSDLAPEVCVGIDLGTTYSCVAVWEDDHVTVIANNLGHRTTPSWVAYTDSDMLVGEAAVAQMGRNTKNTIYDAKRMIGRKQSDPSVQMCAPLWLFDLADTENCCVKVKRKGEDKVVTPEEVSATVLMKMKWTAEAYLGQPVQSVVVTVPAYFNDGQRQATIDACTIAGLTLKRIINEPTAAALAYGLERGSGSDGSKTLLIYDFGGGTLDVTILVIDHQVFEVKSTSGDMQLGGQDFDNNLVKYFAPQVTEKCNGADIMQNPKALKKLRDECQKLKHALSHSVEASIEVDAIINGEDFDSSLTRQEFDDINADLFERCLLPVDRAISDAGITRDDIDEVVLIGGSSRIVQVQNLLERQFPGKVSHEFGCSYFVRVSSVYYLSPVL
jgi:L1 cell adhesion molecule like protein